MRLTKHHLIPRARGGPDAHNIVHWDEAYHQAYHTLFEELVLPEVHEMLDVLTFSPFGWNRHEFGALRNAFLDGCAKKFRTTHEAEQICLRMHISRITPPDIRYDTYVEAYQRFFGNLSLPACHRFLYQIVRPGDEWTDVQLQHKKAVLQRSITPPLIDRRKWDVRLSTAFHKKLRRDLADRHARFRARYNMNVV